jgi:hypothetical protein
MSAPWEDGKAERWLGLMVVAFNLFFACTQKPSSSATFLPIYMRPGARFRSPASLGASMAPLHFSRGGKSSGCSLDRSALFTKDDFVLTESSKQGKDDVYYRVPCI